MVSCRTPVDADGTLFYFYQFHAGANGALPAFPAHGYYFLEHAQPRNDHEPE